MIIKQQDQKGKSMYQKLAEELIEASQNKGIQLKRKKIHIEWQANRAFALLGNK